MPKATTLEKEARWKQPVQPDEHVGRARRWVLGWHQAVGISKLKFIRQLPIQRVEEQETS